MRSISFGQDGDFSIEDVLARYSADLGNALGNLLNRVLPFAETVPEKSAPTPLEDELTTQYPVTAEAVARAFDENNPTAALNALWSLVYRANEYVDKAAPWAAKKNDPARLGTIVATLVELHSRTDRLSRLRRPAAARGDRRSVLATDPDRLQNVVLRLRNDDSDRQDLIDAGIGRIQRPRDRVEPHVAFDRTLKRPLEGTRGRGGEEGIDCGGS